MQKYTAKFRFIIFLILILTKPYAFSAYAEETASKTVRIGYYKGSSDFQEGFSDEERKSGYAYEYYQKIAELTGWNYEYVYGSRAEVFDKLLSGEADIVAGIYNTDKLSNQVLFSKYDMGLEGEKRYFAINVERSDLLDEFNKAQEELEAYFPYFTMALKQEYYSKDPQQQVLNEEEKKWLSEKGSLNFGYVDGNLPLSDQDENGNLTGVVKELAEIMSSYMHISFNPICYDNMTLMEEGLKNNEIDIAFPIYSDLWLNEVKGFFQTEAFISDRVMIVYKGEYRNDLVDKIAISETGLGQRYYVSSYYPDSELLYYETKTDSFKAMQNGDVNCMIGCASIMQSFFAEHPEYSDYHIAYFDASEEFTMAVNRGSNRLIGILNKAVHQFDDAAITNAMIQYSDIEKPYSFIDFLRHYAVAVIAILSAFFALLLWLFINFRGKTILFNKEQVKTRAALEDALRLANSANQAKTTFLSSMSHDIRTPMNGIIGMTAIAAAHLDNPAKVADCLSKITSSGKHLLALINDVLDMSKIESGEINLSEELINLCTLMDDLITLNKSQADARHHELIVHTLNISHEEVIGDSLRLQQVFTNIVSNAIKYTPEGGRIEITLLEKNSRSPKLGCFEFIVEDNGIGMNKDYIPHIFETFTRADNINAVGAQGTGLGMAITKNIVNMMDGDIKVESREGFGSKFTVTLFLKLKETKKVNYDEFVNLDILVVDDDPIICESTCVLLSELGMNSESVLLGKEAIELVEKRHKDKNDYFAVLIDWKMPDMDGVDTTKEIRKRVGDNVPLIIISSYDWSSIEVEATMAGVNGFVGKPLFKSRLVHLFNNLLGNKASENDSGLKELTENIDLTGKRALLAEDNEINAEIAIEILNMIGLKTEWANNGKEAVEKMKNSRPGYYDCIFMDVQMPVMNGLEATKEIRRLNHDDAKTIPIFAMTANAFADDVQAVLNAGMNEHIAKPLNFDVLIDILNKYLNPSLKKKENGL